MSTLIQQSSSRPSSEPQLPAQPSAVKLPLELKLEQLIRRVRRANLIRGAALVGAVATGSLGIAAALDMVTRSPSRGTQAVLAAAFVGMVVAGLRWLGKPIWRARYDRVAIARRVELSFPELRGVLASAIDFAGQAVEDPLAGSARLRASVIERATRLAEPLDFAVVIDLRPARAAIGALLVATFGVGVATWFFPSAAPLSAQRILMPWRELPWPRRHHLELDRPPTKIATGQDLELTVVDAHGRAPTRVELRWRWQGELVEQRQWGEATEDPARVRFRLERIARPIEVRATGGDDDTMGWLLVDVVEAPRVETLELRVVPPDYTGLSAQVASQPVRGWIGSRIALRGLATRPLSVAVIRRLPSLDGSDAPDERERGRGREADGRKASQSSRIPVAIDASGRGLSLAANSLPSWEIRDSAVYALEVTDHDGVSAEAARWVVQAVRDQPPLISWRTPADNAYCVSDASVPIRAAVGDDLHLSSVELRYRMAGEAESRTVELAAALRTKSAVGAARSSVEVVFEWQLASAGPPATGKIVEYWLAARDSLGQLTESPARRLEILSSEAVAERLALRESQLLERLRNALLAQREAQSATADSSTSNDSSSIPESAATPDSAKDADGPTALPTAGTGMGNAPNAEQLQSAFLAQRLVRRKLEEAGDAAIGEPNHAPDDAGGVRESLLRLAAEADWSGGADNALVARLRAIADSLAALVAGPLPTAERELQHTIRRRQERQPDWSEPLANARAAQSLAVAALESIVEKLAPWNQLRRYAEELGELREALAQDLVEIELRLADQTSVGTSEDPSGRESPERRRLAERQFESSRRLDRLLEKLEAGLKLGQSDPAWRAAVGAAVEIARDASLPGAVWEAGNNVQSSRFGAAAENQRLAVDTVDAMLDKLAGGRDRKTAGSDASQKPEPPETAARRETAEAWDAAIKPWVPRQSAIVDSLASLIERDDATRRTVAERHQRELATEAERAVGSLPPSPVYGFALNGVIREMTRAADQLKAVQLGSAHGAAQDALRRLERLQTAVSDEAAGPTMLDEPMSADEPPVDENRRPPRGTLAELRLLRECQADLRNRTAEIADSIGPADAPLADATRKLLDEIAREQASLADLLEKLLP